MALTPSMMLRGSPYLTLKIFLVFTTRSNDISILFGAFYLSLALIVAIRASMANITEIVMVR